MSDEAPVVILSAPNIKSSAILPPHPTRRSATNLSTAIETRSPSGSLITIPSARPLGIIVALCIGSDAAQCKATTAWPASWYAVSFFSSSVITIDRRSEPIITLSLASSNSAIDTVLRPFRAANNAASLTRLAKSAPEKPGVPLAIMRASTSLASGVLRICTFKIFSRPITSGFGTTT